MHSFIFSSVKDPRCWTFDFIMHSNSKERGCENFRSKDYRDYILEAYTGISPIASRYNQRGRESIICYVCQGKKNCCHPLTWTPKGIYLSEVGIAENSAVLSFSRNLSIELLAILWKGLDRVIFLYCFIREVYFSDVRAYISVLHIKKF